MNKFLQQIEAFHIKYQLQYKDNPRFLPPELAQFRAMFMEEELEEYRQAETLEDKLDALIDLVYVALGTAYLHGFDFEEGFNRVHSANMAKVRAEVADDSKRGTKFDVIKPAGWTPPDLSDLVHKETA